MTLYLRDVMSKDAAKVLDTEVMPFILRYGPIEQASSNMVIAWLLEEIVALRRRLEGFKVDVDIIQEGGK